MYYNNNDDSQFQTWLSNQIYFTGECIIELNILENNYAKFQVALYETGKSNEYFTVTFDKNETGIFQAIISESRIDIYLNGILKEYLLTQNKESLSFFIKCPTNTTLDFRYNQLIIYKR